VSRVYSAHLGGGVGLGGGPTVLGIVPVGKVWVVRHITVTFHGALTIPLNGWIVYNGANEWLWSRPGADIVTDASEDWSGRHVLDAGDSLIFESIDTADYNVLASGYELTTP
jgi:hypothetical protein